ncbi:MAG: MBL fold metallo-hydrolase [Acidimicrobiia bacterium]|nr:MBL fold metallo-hydrolase [Acidimicrobiia bacterium]
MKVRTFHADDGDCLIVETDDAVLLVDGGRMGTFTDHTSSALSLLSETGRAIDAVLVSHIDADHISGILRLLDDVVARRRHLFQTADPDSGPYEPPRLAKIWHNTFDMQLGRDATELATALMNAASTLAASSADELMSSSSRLEMVALSQKQSAELTLQATELLEIPINPETEGRPIVVTDDVQLTLGAAKVHVLGPFQEDLDKLRAEFDDWLADNRDTVATIRREMREEAAAIENDVDRLVLPLENAAKKLGDRASVTVPNLASLMMLIEEDGNTVLLTGDGHGDDVLRGLEHRGLIDEDRGLHVDVLKIPHHGSEHNIDRTKTGRSFRSDFLQKVTADHYIFCANGAHKNPDRDIVKAVIDSRVGPAAVRSPNPECDQYFKLWFTTHPDSMDGERRDHLRTVRRYVSRRSGDRFAHEWLEGDEFSIDLDA